MSLEPDKNLRRKQSKAFEMIYETGKVFFSVFIFFFFVYALDGDEYSPVMVACVGLGLGLFFVSDKLDLNFLSGTVLFIGWALFTYYVVSLPQCVNQENERRLEYNARLLTLPQWSPNLSKETLEKFHAGEQVLVFDFSKYPLLPSDLENLDPVKVQLRYRYDFSDHEELERHKKHSYESCKNSSMVFYFFNNL
jgi:hypothetical protein